MNQPEQVMSPEFKAHRKKYQIFWVCGLGLFILGLLIKNLNAAHSQSEALDLVYQLCIAIAFMWMVVITAGYALKTQMLPIWAYLLGVLMFSPPWWIISFIILMFRKPKPADSGSKSKSGIGKVIGLVVGILLIIPLMVMEIILMFKASDMLKI